MERHTLGVVMMGKNFIGRGPASNCSKSYDERQTATFFIIIILSMNLHVAWWISQMLTSCKRVLQQLCMFRLTKSPNGSNY